MPRKVNTKLEKVISSKITVEMLQALEKYAREYYIANRIKQPTVSDFLRWIISGWLKAKEEHIKNKER